MQCIGQVGTVHRVTERGDIRVQFDNNQRWTFHPRAIHRLSAFSVGDAVRITDDVAEVKQLQRGHGEWVEIMRSVRLSAFQISLKKLDSKTNPFFNLKALGKIGKVVKVYADGDLRVTVDGQTWTLNPLCLTPLPGSATELHNTMAASVRQEHTSKNHTLNDFIYVNMATE